MRILDQTTKALGLSLNLRQMRQDVISSNIANSDTPQYKAKKLDFEEALSVALNTNGQEAMKTDDSRHYNLGGGSEAALSAQIYDDPNGVVSEDGNTVDRDAEFAAMAENKILYDASVTLLNKKLGLLKYAITNDR